MRYGIDSLQLTNFGKIGSAHFDHFSGINLIIGENGTGKTCLLKAMYSAVRSFGFDDTHYDLVRALQIPPTRGKNYSAFSESRKIVTDVIDGKVDYDIDTGKWFYKNRIN